MPRSKAWKDPLDHAPRTKTALAWFGAVMATLTVVGVLIGGW